MSTPLFAAVADRGAEIDQSIVALIYGAGDAIYSDQITFQERLVLKALRFHRGASNPVTIRELRAKTELSEREIKNAVRALRLSFRIPIGASRDGERGGYFLIVSAEDLALFLHGALRQIQAEAEVVRAVAGRDKAAEMLGQLVLAFEAEAR